MSNQTKYIPLNSIKVFEQRREVLIPWLTFMFDLSKVSTLISVPVGLFLLSAYFNVVGSPMLTPDSSTALTLILIVASYAFMSSFVLLFLCTPMFTCYVSPRTRDMIRTQHGTPQLWFKRRLPSALKSWQKSWHNPRHKNEFLIFHSTSIFIILACFIVIAFATVTQTVTSAMAWSVSLLASTLLGLAVSLFLYKSFGVLPYPNSMVLSKRFRNLAYYKIIGGGLTRALMTFVWLASIIEVFSVFGTKMLHYSQIEVSYGTCGLCIGLLILYLFLTNARVRIARVPVLILALALIFAIFNPSFAGSLSLRVLGIGGGIPISITVKTMVPGFQVTSATIKTGCLIIRSGSEFVIRTIESPTLDKCRIHLRADYPDSKGVNVPTFKQVEVFPSSQILQINKSDDTAFK